MTDEHKGHEMPEDDLTRAGIGEVHKEGPKQKGRGKSGSNGTGPRNDGAPPIGEPKNRKIPETPRDTLTLSAWLERTLPPRDWLFENLMCTTSRWLIFGDTGVGKTLFNLPMAAAAADGVDFLDWKGSGTRRRTVYFDGEMPAETAQERLRPIGERHGRDLPLWFYNRDVLHDREMPPLNTEDGERWLMREVEALKPDFIVFDSIMSLLAGSMSDAESWAPIILLMRKLTSKRIAQVWLHHTGHDSTRGYGDKTREWQLDTVGRLTASGDGDNEPITLDFTKARLRTPETRHLYAPKLIVCGPDGWAVQGPGVANTGRNRPAADPVKRAILDAYDRLADGVTPTGGFAGEPVRKVSVEWVRNGVRDRGFLDTNEKSGGITAVARNTFMRAKKDLLARHVLGEAGGMIWRISKKPHYQGGEP
jgi:AAA domain